MDKFWHWPTVKPILSTGFDAFSFSNPPNRSCCPANMHAGWLHIPQRDAQVSRLVFIHGIYGFLLYNYSDSALYSLVRLLPLMPTVALLLWHYWARQPGQISWHNPFSWQKGQAEEEYRGFMLYTNMLDYLPSYWLFQTPQSWNLSYTEWQSWRQEMFVCGIMVDRCYTLLMREEYRWSRHRWGGLT